MNSLGRASAQRTETDGRSFASKLEASVYQILKLREKAGEIFSIRHQVTVDLGFDIHWRVDFSFIEYDKEQQGLNQTVYAEAKGFEEPVYKLKLKLWRNGAGPGKLEIWKGTHSRAILDEIVIPKPLVILNPKRVFFNGVEI